MVGLLSDTNAFHTSFLTKKEKVEVNDQERHAYGYPVNMRERMIKRDAEKFRAITANVGGR